MCRRDCSSESELFEPANYRPMCSTNVNANSDDLFFACRINVTRAFPATALMTFLTLVVDSDVKFRSSS